MSVHPSIDALQAHLDVPDSSLSTHLESCAECSRRASRLAGGLAAIDEARRHTPAPPPWERMDEALTREALSVSQEIRAGRLRPATRVPSWVATGLAMAAGVGLLVGGRELLRRREPPAVAPIARRAAPTPAPAATLTPFEGVVLLASGGARYRDQADANGVLLSSATGLHEGASVETPASARAVFTVRSGWTADVRGGSSLKLSQLRTEQTAVTIERGEIALTPVAGEAQPVRVLHGGWSVEPQGALLARLEPTVMRVVVLAGRTDIRREGAETLTVTGPLVIDLPLDGGAPVRTTLSASDAAALDLAAFGAQGTRFDIPAIDPAATLTLLNHGALPSALESIRLAGPGTIQARLGRNETRLELGAGGTPRWAAFRSPTAATVALNRVNAIAPVAPSPESQAPGLSPGRLAAVSNSTARRIQHCFATCLEQNRCREPMSGVVTFGVSDDGHATVSSIHPSAAGARRCIEGEAPSLPGLRTGSPYDFEVGIRSGSR